MVSRLARDVKRLSFDGCHTRTAVFYSQQLAPLWVGTTMIQTGTMELADTNRNAANTEVDTFSPAQLKQQC
ncbi:hypothetical protein PC129_g18791 [Phytophthora cactorum]|uniref:Uncharacterized protein n=1 Tax=Phytophthora cactorum TaxID=29920 RepID=A0A8T1A3V9_9STRA|nr:hypothetical protein Pcac1_g26705 [Phytophthora cactorum]KAG2863117.1 hypothetical protein PC114_g28161 [Phytophthora cactorum]KAG2869923.1 hypothetical protein PC115_g25281 [Phytophthora cactorum]KAG2968529.1 hypothetical protein PC118_g17963 [Phytophthora cactorum]KAG2989125.1 hypothetical protein PC119_g19365 [Phytophthora cactorum]